MEFAQGIFPFLLIPGWNMDIPRPYFLQMLNAIFQPKPFICVSTEHNQNPNPLEIQWQCNSNWLPENQKLKLCSPLNLKIRNLLSETREGRNKGVWFKQGLAKRRSSCPFKLEQAGWNAETTFAVLTLNFWMPEWTIKCVFIFCWHVVP